MDLDWPSVSRESGMMESVAGAGLAIDDGRKVPRTPGIRRGFFDRHGSAASRDIQNI